MKKILISLLLLFLSCPVFCFDREDIRNEVRDVLRDNQASTTRRRFSNTTLNRRINISQKNIAAYTRCLTSRIRVTTIADQRGYIMPNIVGEITRVSYSISTDTTTYKRLPRVNYAKLDQDTAQWDNEDSSDPNKYCLRRNRVELSPPPATAYAGTYKLQVDFAVIPDDLDDDDDVPWNDKKALYPYHELIISDVLSMCFFQERDITMGEYYDKRTEFGMEQMKKRLNERGDVWNFGKLRGKLRQ